MSLAATKLTLLLAVLAAGWLGGVLPLLKSVAANDRFLGRGNAFAAGIFLGAGLIHMLAEAQATWSALGWEYPIALTLAAAAFTTVLLFEHVLLPESAHGIVHQHPGHSVTEREMHAISHSGYPYMLVVALSIHSVIAGVALGAQDTAGQVWVIFLAIIAHKSTAGFALGISLARHRVAPARCHGLVALFAWMTPLGIALGMGAGTLLSGAGETYFDAAFLALAAGTFIYIAALDIIQDEFLRPGSRLLKWAFTALGVALTAVLALWI